MLRGVGPDFPSAANSCEDQDGNGIYSPNRIWPAVCGSLSPSIGGEVELT